MTETASERTRIPDWVRSAEQLPVNFMQVLEDSRTDLEVLQMARPGARILMVASGGCTAADLAAAGGASFLHVVDIVARQVPVVRLKLYMLAEWEPADRRRLMGYDPAEAGERRALLSRATEALNISEDAFGPPEEIARAGLRYFGRMDRMWCEVQRRLSPASRAAIEGIIAGTRRGPAPIAKGLEVDLEAAMRSSLADEYWEPLFDRVVRDNWGASLWEVFFQQTVRCIEGPTAEGNPYLSYVLLGRYTESAPLIWLQSGQVLSMPAVQAQASDLGSVLASSPPGEYDIVHASNIFDYMPEDAVRKHLENAWRALRGGGWVVIRQNGAQDLAALEPRFDWDRNRARKLYECDRGFLYAGLALGRKP